MSQNESILKHLQSGKAITAMGALYKFQCFRLAARIADIKSQGYDIVTRKVKTDSGKMVAEYRL